MGNKLPDAILEQVRGLDATALAELAQLLNPTASQAPVIEHGRQDGKVFRNGPANITNQADISSRTIELLQQTQSNVTRSGINVATGFIGYDLKVPAATLVPYLTPMLNMTPREDGVGIDVHHWKAITDFFGGSGAQGVIGAVADGGTPSFLSYNVTPMQNTFQTIGQQNSLTFQAEWRGRQLEGDMRSMLASQVLFALKLIEENWLINMSDKLWTPPVPLTSPSTTGGSLASTNPYWFVVTAKSANGETLGTQLIGPVTIASGSTGSIALTIFTVPFATVYNVYAATAASAPANSALFLQSAASNFGGASALNQPSNPSLGSFTATLTSLTTSGTAYSTVTANTAKVAVDGSSNAITWQGSRGLIHALAGSNTGNGTGGLVSQLIAPAAATGYLALSDIQQLLLQMYQNARANPRYLFISPQDSVTLSNLVSNNGNVRVNIDASKAASQQGELVAGYRVGQILNQVTQSMVEVVPLPYLAQGAIIAGSYSFPYPVAGFSQDPFRVIANRDYYGVEYPPTQTFPTSWGWGAYVDSTVCNEYPGGWGEIQGIVYH